MEPKGTIRAGCGLAIALAALFVAATAILAADSTPVPGWDVSKSEDPLDDTRQVIAMLSSEDDSMHLGFRCDVSSGGRPSFFVIMHTTAYLGDGSRKVEYRFGKRRKHGPERWNVIRDRLAVARDSEGFAARVLVSETLAFRVHDYDDEAHTAEFDLSRAVEGTAEVLSMCGLELDD